VNWDALSPEILVPALLAGLLVIATHVPLGQQVLARGIVFIDLAIAQIAGLGVIAAGVLGFEQPAWAVQIAAVGASMLGALLLTWTDRRWPEVQEALIGVLFVLAATAGILLLANNPHGGEHLKDLLVGQILWVTPADLLPVALISVLVLAVWFGWRSRLGPLGFYALFALSVTASVQLVGIYLVFSSLIIPALASRRQPEPRRLWLAYGVGAGGYILGLVVSALSDLPSGPVIVWALALLGVLVAWRTPRPGATGPDPL